MLTRFKDLNYLNYFIVAGQDVDYKNFNFIPKDFQRIANLTNLTKSSSQTFCRISTTSCFQAVSKKDVTREKCDMKDCKALKN